MSEERKKLTPREKYEILEEECNKLKRRMRLIDQLLPMYFFNVTFKAESRDGSTREYQECIYSLHPKLVILELEERCKDFKFINIQKVT